MNTFAALQSFLSPWFYFLSDDPLLRGIQLVVIALGLVMIFLVLFTTRDVLLRTHSFWLMLLSIVLVAAIPVVGFLIYLLIRPSRTLVEREMDCILRGLAGEKSPAKAKS